MDNEIFDMIYCSVVMCMCRECAIRALEDVKKFLLIEGGQVAVSYFTV